MNKIIGKFCELEVFSREHLKKLYNIEIDIDRMPYFSENMKLISFEEYASYIDRRLKNHYHAYFIVRKKHDKSIIGYLYTYNYNSANGYIYMSISSNEVLESLYSIAEAGILFINYLFDRYNLRKIYAEIYGFNIKSEHIVKNVGFKLEGKLKEHRYYRGCYYDLLTYALYRDKFYKNIKTEKIIKYKICNKK